MGSALEEVRLAAGQDGKSGASVAQPSPRLLRLEEVNAAGAVGGKAAQLGALVRLGLRVPPGFVVIHARPGELPQGLESETARLQGPVAVRSSALEEDGAEASFAGQFESVLGVQGSAEIRAAIEHCLASAASQRANAYRHAMRADGAATMAVVVQQMIKAQTSGVVFTADPVAGKRDRIVINAGRGMGDAIVSGHRSADHFVLTRDGTLLESNLQSEHPVLTEANLRELLRDALRAEAAFGRPLDLEWAIGQDHQLYWLQARPITTLDLPGLDEMDERIDPSWQLTTYNVTEWMPGAMTPLSLSIVVPAYTEGVRELYARIGVPRHFLEEMPLMVSIQGHAFINMSASYVLGSFMFGMGKESADLSLTGQVLPQADLPPPAPVSTRLLNTLRNLWLVPQGRRRLDAFVAQHSDFKIEPSDDLSEFFQRLDQGLAIFKESSAVHVHTSMLVNAFLGLFQRVYGGGAALPVAGHAAIAALLSGAKFDAPNAASSSIGVADAIDQLGALIASEHAAAQNFVALSAGAALAWLQFDAPEKVRAAFTAFLSVHGHRCIRELELRERDWREDPLPLVSSLQLAVATPKQTQIDWRAETRSVLAQLPWPTRLLVRRLLPITHAAIVQRERSKSFSVWIERQLKRAYVNFAQRLVVQGRLPDTDLVFFFTHEELRGLAQSGDRALWRRGEHRRRLHPQKMALEFPPVCKGKPQPLAQHNGSSSNGDSMCGVPLSRGIAVGPARVVRTVEEASAMHAGEILVTPFTDVGWTPFFGRAAGLATEVGSVLSHGAVVAREYGLPAIAGLPGATHRFKTGDVLYLNGNTGELRRVG